jgi:hypothetical protein
MILQKLQLLIKQYKNINLVLKMWLGLLLIILCVTEIKSQGICVPETLKIISLSGQVITVQNVPLAESTIEIRTPAPEKKTIAKVKADKNGYFAFTNIKAGKYIIYAEHPYYNHFVFPVKLHKLSKAVSKNKLMIVIGLKNEVCDGSYATYGDQTTVKSN